MSELDDLIRSYNENEGNLKSLRNSLREASRWVKHFASVLDYNPADIRIDGNAIHVGYGSPIPISAWMALVESLQALEQARQQKAEMEKTLREAGLEHIIQAPIFRR